MNLGEYIKEKIKNFEIEYFNPQRQVCNLLQDKIVKHKKSQYNEVTSNWSRINNNEDVQSYLNAVISQVNLYTSIINQDNPLCLTDYFDVYLSMYSLIYALQKVASCYNVDSCYNNNSCNFNYSEKDIDQIFDTLEKMAKQFNDIQMRNACRD